MEKPKILGVDVGASGIKGAVVNINTGEFLTERLRLETPQPATPKAMANTFAELVRLLEWDGPIGCGFPSIVKKGVAQSAANIHKDWIGVDIEKIFSKASNNKVKVLNDADAAGIGEIMYGGVKDTAGTALLITIGSGLGSALFRDGQLIPNTEFGHIFFKGGIAEHYAANSVRKGKELDWEEWGTRLNEYLLHLDRILSPNLIILGGGVSKRFDKYAEYITVDTKVKTAKLLNNAGIAGAAYYAYQCL